MVTMARFIIISHLMSSGLVLTGFSMAVRQRICRRWFCITSLIIPNWSKYPPRPCVPKGSLKVILTLAMLSLFQVGPNIMFPNLRLMRFCTIGAIFDFWSGRTCPPLGRTGNMTGEDLGGHQRKWGGLRRTANKTGEKTLIQPELNS